MGDFIRKEKLIFYVERKGMQNAELGMSCRGDSRIARKQTHTVCKNIKQ